MDASAYLQKHGWRGLGHSLDRTDRGIKRPLLISKKVDVLGVGLNKHAAVSDQWWLRAFDDGLKAFGTGAGSALGHVQKHGVNRGGLYARFVKGEPIPGSLGSPGLPTPDDSDVSAVKEVSAASPAMAAPKRKHAAEGEQVKQARRKTGPADDAVAIVDEETVSNGAVGDDRLAHERRMDAIERRAAQLLAEAQSRGIIPLGLKDARKGGAPTGANAVPMKQVLDSQDLEQILQQPGVQDAMKIANKAANSSKAQKYARESLKREFRRAAKAYLVEEDIKEFGAPPPADKPRSKTKAECKQMGKEAKKARKELKLAASQERQREVAVQARDTKPNGITNGPADADSRSSQKEALEKVKIDTYHATKHGMTLDKYRDALAKGDILPPGNDASSLSDKKRAEYAARAAEKGITLEQYIRRRQEKYAAKQAEKLGDTIQETMLDAATRAQPQSALDEDVAFVVDTVGDATLVSAGRSAPTTGAAPKRVKVSKGSELALEALAAIVEKRPFTIPALDGGEDFTWEPQMPVPKEPRIWEGIVVKELPKSVRVARREWMQDRREAKKLEAGKLPKKEVKTRGERKIEQRESFVREILAESRKARATGASAKDVTLTIQGIENVPLVKVESKQGQPFSKVEMGLARTVARRVTKAAKREERKQSKEERKVKPLSKQQILHKEKRAKR